MIEMQDEIKKSIQKLSSKMVMERKQALKELIRYLDHKDGYLARLSLLYVAEHDPSYTVRNIARQAFYRIGGPPKNPCIWERTYFF